MHRYNQYFKSKDVDNSGSWGWLVSASFLKSFIKSEYMNKLSHLKDLCFVCVMFLLLYPKNSNRNKIQLLIILFFFNLLKVSIEDKCIYLSFNLRVTPGQNTEEKQNK